METSKRSRRPEGVTSNACTECRRRRSKCDGRHPCSACVARDDRVCIYKAHQQIAKRALLDRIGRLEARCQKLDGIVRAIASSENPNALVQQLKGAQTHESIASQIAASPSPGLEESDGDEKEEQDILDTLYQPAQGSHSSADVNQELESHIRGAPNTLRHSRLAGSRTKDDVISGAKHVGRTSGGPDGTLLYRPYPTGSRIDDSTDPTNSMEPWTSVTGDEAYIKHLLRLYFCWEYPTIASFSKVHFLHDFGSGRRRFCSSLLVNAILSLACRFSDKPQGRTDPGDGTTAGDLFFEEAKALLVSRADRSLPTIQALALMSLRQASHGQERISWFYASQSIQMAVESGLHMDHTALSGSTFSREEREVRLATFWGCFALDQAWSLFVGRIPHISRHAIRAPAAMVIEDVEAEEWIPYTDEGISLIPRTTRRHRGDGRWPARGLIPLNLRTPLLSYTAREGISWNS